MPFSMMVEDNVTAAIDKNHNMKRRLLRSDGPLMLGEHIFVSIAQK